MAFKFDILIKFFFSIMINGKYNELFKILVISGGSVNICAIS